MILLIGLQKKRVREKALRNKGFTPLEITGTNKRSAKFLTGFTLIELLIVCAIILALVSFSTPLFRKQFTDLELKETASNITKFINFAQEKAIVDRNIYKISFNFEKKRYQLLVAVGSEGQNITYDNLKDRFGRVFNLPSSINIEGQANKIVFYPDGHSDKVEIKLISKNNKTLKIASTGILGNVIITEEK